MQPPTFRSPSYIASQLPLPRSFDQSPSESIGEEVEFDEQSVADSDVSNVDSESYLSDVESDDGRTLSAMRDRLVSVDLRSKSKSEILSLDSDNSDCESVVDLNMIDSDVDDFSNDYLEELANNELGTKSEFLVKKFNAMGLDDLGTEFSRSVESRCELLRMMHFVLVLKGVSDATLNAKKTIVSFACLQETSVKSDILGVDCVCLSLVDLRGMNFSGINLSGADFSGADLADANFGQANLFRANLRRANLVRANLFHTNLCWADLSDSNLTDAFLNAYLVRSNLDNVILDGVNLSFSDFSRIYCKRFTKDDEVFSALDLVASSNFIFLGEDNEDENETDRGIGFQFSRFWTKTNITGQTVNFEWVSVPENIDCGDLLGRTASIAIDDQPKKSVNGAYPDRNSVGINFFNVDFRDVDVFNSDFRGSDLSHANFGVELYGIYSICGTSRKQLANLISITPSLKIVNAENSDFRWTRLNFANFKAANLRNANFGGADLRRANFIGADLRGVNFRDADLTGANFAMANLSGVDFSGMDLRGIDFSGADLTGANFSGAKMDGTILRNADLRGIKIDAINLTRAVVTGANFSHFNFQGMDLTGVRFDGANMQGANLQGATLNRTCFNRVNLTDAVFYFMDLRIAYTESRIELDRAVFSAGWLECITAPVIQPRPLIIENPVSAETIVPYSDVAIPRTSSIMQRNSASNSSASNRPAPIVRRNVASPVVSQVNQRRQSVWSWLSDVPLRIGSFFKTLFLGMFRPR